MRFIRYFGICCVGLVFIAFLGILGVQKEPRLQVLIFESEILDRRYKGVSVVTGAPSEGEVKVLFPDGRTLWLPSLKYYLNETKTKACVATSKGKLSGVLTYQIIRESECSTE